MFGLDIIIQSKNMVQFVMDGGGILPTKHVITNIGVVGIGTGASLRCVGLEDLPCEGRCKVLRDSTNSTASSETGERDTIDRGAVGMVEQMTHVDKAKKPQYVLPRRSSILRGLQNLIGGTLEDGLVTVFTFLPVTFDPAVDRD
jgi:hypothetical protein